LLAASGPATEHTLDLRPLKSLVTVLRDRWGIPHIYAQNQHDLFFAQGFVAAQDRLFQMELWKRTGQGRSAEILGEKYLVCDIGARLLRYRGDLKAEFDSYSPEARNIVESFVAGINANISQRTMADDSDGLAEFRIAGFEPERWKAEDCISRHGLFPTGCNALKELYHAQLVAAIGPERASRLLNLDPPILLDPDANLDFAGLSPKMLRRFLSDGVTFRNAASEGSNGWVISGDLTQSGRPILANDPHRKLTLPSQRYITHLIAPGWNVIGAGEPWLPGVAIGHNDRIAWGFAVAAIDQQDLYVEELNPANSLEYHTEHGWERLEEEQHVFKILGASDKKVSLRFSRHGPVLWSDSKRAVAMRWVGSEPGTAPYLGALAINQAKTWREFKVALRRWKAPPENFVYADTEGAIGQHCAGLTPIRKDWSGLLPVSGTSGHEWVGFVPTDELPNSFNPERGFLVVANQRTIPDNYPYRVGYEWLSPYRFMRISEVLIHSRKNGTKLDVQDSAKLQNDLVTIPGKKLIEILRTAVGREVEFPQNILFNWDCSVERDSGATALYEIWLEELTLAVMRKVSPSSVWKMLEYWPTSQVLKHLTRPKREIFGPDPVTGRRSLMVEALKSAAKELSRLQGDDTSSWSWGLLHLMEFRHPLEKLPKFKRSFGFKAMPRPGDEHTVNATAYINGYGQTFGASYRQILDLSDWDRSISINVPGQSGEPGASHYSDLLTTWANGQYFPLSYTRQAIERTTTNRLLLRPDSATSM
jgi:penicillin amidase